MLRILREELDALSPNLGLTPGYTRFRRIVMGSPALQARLWRMQLLAVDSLGRTLRNEAGAAPEDPLPELIAGQIGWVQNTLIRSIAIPAVQGGDLKVIAQDAMRRLDAIDDLLGEQVLNYATKDTG